MGGPSRLVRIRVMMMGGKNEWVGKEIVEPNFLSLFGIRNFGKYKTGSLDIGIAKA